VQRRGGVPGSDRGLLGPGQVSGVGLADGEGGKTRGGDTRSLRRSSDSADRSSQSNALA
jgi:hypothetical protein